MDTEGKTEMKHTHTKRKEEGETGILRERRKRDRHTT